MKVELGDDLLRQVGLNTALPEEGKIKQLKFDAKGTAHLLVRDNDEKLLKDISFTNVRKEDDTDEYIPTQYEEYLTLKSKTKITLLFRAQLLALAVLTGLTMVMVYMLR